MAGFSPAFLRVWWLRLKTHNQPNLNEMPPVLATSFDDNVLWSKLILSCFVGISKLFGGQHERSMVGDLSHYLCLMRAFVYVVAWYFTATLCLYAWPHRHCIDTTESGYQ